MNDEELHALGKEYEERVKARTASNPEVRKSHELAAKRWAEAKDAATDAKLRDSAKVSENQLS